MINNLNNDSISTELDKFIDAIDLYISNPRNIEDQKEVIIQGLNVFDTLPNTEFTTIFLVNPLTFEFQHKFTIPDEKTVNALSAFQLFNDNGTIGKAIQNIKPSISPEISIEVEEVTEVNDCLLVPLMSAKGISGIIMTFGKGYDSYMSKFLIRNSFIIGSQIASNLEKNHLFNNLNNVRVELEQKVAARTMDLANSKRELKAIFDSVHTGIMVIDEDSDKVIKVNPVAIRLLKETEVSILRAKSMFYFEQLDTANIEQNKNFESFAFTKDYQTIPIIRSVSFIHVNGVRSRIESFVDISEIINAQIALKEANELLELKVAERTIELEKMIEQLNVEIKDKENAESELRKMLEKEKEINELRTQFVNLVSHEFKTPLTNIKSASQILLDFIESISIEERSKYLTRISKTVDYMSEMVEQVLFIGKAENHNAKKEYISFNLSEYCINLIDEIKFSLNHNRIINFKIENFKENIYCDQNLLKLILSNLLTNAIKFSDVSQPIDFSVKIDDKYFYFYVQDYGIGIPNEDKIKIFDLFYRSTNADNITGSGLGMTVIKQALLLLEGKISFDTKLGEGTKFTVSIPK